MSAFKKPAILIIIALFSIGAAITGESGAAGWLCFTFILYLMFGED